jgi:hypothetical protein
MRATIWLVPLLLVVSSVAHAQDTQQQANPVPDVSIPGVSGQVSGQDGAPPLAAPVQPAGPAQGAVPATDTSAQLSQPVPPALAPVPYLVPPAPAPGTIVLPPYPGPAPYRFSSPDEAVDYGTWRLEQLTARERGLTLLGRPPAYTTKRVEAFVLLGLGAVVAATCAAGALLAEGIPSTGADHDDSDARMARGLGVGALGGVAVFIGGAVWLAQLKRDNPYHDEIRVLRQERKDWLVEVKRARRRARASLRSSFDLTRLQVRF